MKFRKKREYIEAIQWDGSSESIQAIQEMTKVKAERTASTDALYIFYPGTVMRVALGEWVIEGKMMPCKDETLKNEYDAIPEFNPETGDEL